MWHILVREFPNADDVGLVAQTEDQLHWLMNHLSHACAMFSLIINIETTVIMGQAVMSPPMIRLTFHWKPTENSAIFGPR